MSNKKYKKVRFGKNKILPKIPKKYGSWEIVDYVPVFSTMATYNNKNVDLDMLESIVRRMKDFGPASIIIGHTGSDNNYDEKDVIGLATNFRIVEGDNNTYYLICDIIIRDADLLSKYPRRSVELWDDFTIDPIALLGSSTPKVDLPVVIKYNRRPRMTNDELNQIADAVLKKLRTTSEWKFLSDLYGEWEDFQKTGGEAEEDETSGTDLDLGMLKDEEDEDTGSPESEEDEYAEDEDEAEGEKEDSGGEEHISDEELDEILDDLGKTFGLTEGEEEGEEDTGKKPEKKKRKYSMSPTNVSIPSHVSSLRSSHRGSSDASVEKLRRENEKLKAMYRREKRSSILKKLQQDGYNLDLNEELKFVENMSDSDFVNYIHRVKKYYRRSPTAPLNPSFVGNAPHITEELRDRAIEYAYNNGISFEEALKKLGTM